MGIFTPKSAWGKQMNTPKVKGVKSTARPPKLLKTSVAKYNAASRRANNAHAKGDAKAEKKARQEMADIKRQQKRMGYI